jgi:hypothetical protein
VCLTCKICRCKPPCRIWHFRALEIILYPVIGLIIKKIIDAYDFNDMSIPDVTYVNATSYENIANNTKYSYPLKFEGHLCWPEELSVCTTDETRESTCCNKLRDEDSWPEQTFDVGDIYLAIGVFLFFTFVRLVMWRHVSRTRSYASICTSYWFMVFMDAVVSCLSATIYASVLTYFVKTIVGAPRPIYYALRLYASVHSSTRSSLKGMCVYSSLSSSLSSLSCCCYMCFV